MTDASIAPEFDHEAVEATAEIAAGSVSDASNNGTHAICLLLGDSDEPSRIGFADGRVWACPFETSSSVADGPSNPLPASVLDRIREAGVDRHGLALGLSSRRCFAVTLPEAMSAPLGVRNRSLARERALRFQAEPFLPVDIEDMAVASVLAANDRSSIESEGGDDEGEARSGHFLVATDAKGTAEVVAALESAGCPVSSVLATTLLAVDETARLHPADTSTHVEVVLDTPAGIEKVRVLQGRPVTWTFGTKSCEQDDSEGGSESNLASHRINARERDVAAIAAIQRLRRRGTFPLDLDAGPLGVRKVSGRTDLGGGRYRGLRQPATAAAASAVLLLAVVLLAVQLRLRETQNVVSDADVETRAIFVAAFPGQSPPVALLARFRSEARSAGVLGEGGLDVAPPPPPQQSSALEGLDRVLGALPPGFRVELDELRIEPNVVFVEGRVRTPGDADRLSSALRQAGLEPQPPRTQALPGGKGAGFTLQAQRTEMTARPSDFGSRRDAG